MDRKELRFRILFEYYNDLHSPGGNVDEKVQAIDVDENEKRAAKIWLMEEGHIYGRISPNGGIPWPFLSRIKSTGVNFVERVMDDAFTEISGKDEGFDSLSKSDKIKRFAIDCLGSPATGLVCEATYEAIKSFMA